MKIYSYKLNKNTNIGALLFHRGDVSRDVMLVQNKVTIPVLIS